MNSWHVEGEDEERGKKRISDGGPFITRALGQMNHNKQGTDAVQSRVINPKISTRLHRTPSEQHGLAFAPCASKIP